MKEKLKLADQLIINRLNSDYGIKATTLELLPIGADYNASIYKAQTKEKTSYFVKLKHGHHHDISLAIMELLRNAGIEQIIAPIKTIHGLSTTHIEDYTLIVYPFIKGQDGFSQSLTNTQWLKLGKALRQVHAINVPPSIASQVRKENFSPKWRDAVRSLYKHIETATELTPSGKAGSPGAPGDEPSLKLLKFMRENKKAIQQLVDRAESLSQRLQGQSQLPEYLLCHSDIHGGNVLIDETGNVYIVDWDDPIMAPKERDLMFIGGGIANVWKPIVWNKPDEEKLFYNGYGKTEVNTLLLAYYRHERIVEDIAFYGQELLLKSCESEDRAEMYEQFIGMFAPHGVVEIAFQTDEALPK